MSAVESPRPTPLSRGFSKLETLPEGFAEKMRRTVGAGDVIGERYQIIRRIGGGAMGDVFLAENMAIGLRVAVKLLKPELLKNPDFRLRFKHEAEAVAAIQHANVTRFLDLVVDDPTFLVMEFVDGPTLEEVIAKEGPLPPRRAVEIAIRLAWGLHAAHKAGVIHRDLKPSNVLLQPDEETGEVPKLIDFGLAKLAQSTREAPLTRVGQIIGTPQYMAPEQVSSKEVDPRTDVYALGCVLYCMLTGRPPFTVAEDEDDMNVLYRQVHEPPEPVRHFAPHIDAALDQAVMKALEKRPNARHASMRDFARALAEKKTLRSFPSLYTIGEETEVVRRHQPPWRLAWAAGGLTLVAATLAAALMLRKPADGFLLVLSDPAGATIDVDGRPIDDRTPAVVRGLQPGMHKVVLHQPHHTDVERAVTLDARSREVIDVRLPNASHRLEVVTSPDGAVLFLDGNVVNGRTPVTVTVDDDDYHLLRVEKEGYETLTRKLKPDDDETSLQLRLQPETQPRGTLFLDSREPAEVWIDGQYTGFLTPTAGLRVTAGEHRVELRSSTGEVGDSMRVKVEKGGTLRLVLGMPRRGKP